MLSTSVNSIESNIHELRTMQWSLTKYQFDSESHPDVLAEILMQDATGRYMYMNSSL